MSDRELGKIVDGYGVEWPKGVVVEEGFIVRVCGNIIEAWEECDRLRAAHRRGVEEGREEGKEVAMIVLDLAMLVRRMANTCNQTLAEQARDYLKRKHLGPSPLREPNTPPPGEGRCVHTGCTNRAAVDRELCTDCLRPAEPQCNCPGYVPDRPTRMPVVPRGTTGAPDMRSEGSGR